MTTEKLNLTFFLVIILLLLGLLGYWSVNTLQSGSEHKLNQKIAELTDENDELKDKIDDLEDELAASIAKIDALEPKEGEGEQGGEEPAEPETPAIPAKHASLIAELEKLVADKVLMKVGSRGTRVGTVQTFLSVYNGTSNKVDNDYGESTKKAVAAFQKAQGLTADGQAGPGTFQKMIAWLMKQS